MTETSEVFVSCVRMSTKMRPIQLRLSYEKLAMAGGVAAASDTNHRQRSWETIPPPQPTRQHPPPRAETDPIERLLINARPDSGVV